MAAKSAFRAPSRFFSADKMNSPAGKQTPMASAGLNTIKKIAILAVGGQGGGVLTNWIENLARSQNYYSQATSVAGVAQRTGATIYYVEMAPKDGAAPVFSLAPSSGDVDVMIAAELMEAGRAVMRGYVTPERTTLIASTHRALAVSEKMVPGDGIASSDEVKVAAEIAAEQLIMFDMDQMAAQNGSVISSTLFGALAGSGALPFPKPAFEDAIRASGKGVDASLRAFNAAFDRVTGGPTEDIKKHEIPAIPAQPAGPKRLVAQWQRLETEAQKLSDSDLIVSGLRKVVDFQDLEYGQEYLNRVAEFVSRDNGNKLLAEAALKYIANAMCYDDIIWVADRKTRRARFERIAADMGSNDKPLRLTEFFHPRGEEIISLLPAGIGTWIENRPRLAAWIDRRVNRGRRMRTHRLLSFLMLYSAGGLQRMRRRSLRHKTEQAHIDAWLDLCKSTIAVNYDCAIELLKCQRLIKGYSDTQVRGHTKFSRIMEIAPLLIKHNDGANEVARLREAALSDESPDALEVAMLQTPIATAGRDSLTLHR